MSYKNFIYIRKTAFEMMSNDSIKSLTMTPDKNRLQNFINDSRLLNIQMRTNETMNGYNISAIFTIHFKTKNWFAIFSCAIYIP